MSGPGFKSVASRALWLISAASLAGLVIASAASLNVTSATVTAASATVSHCTTTGAAVNPNIAAGQFVSVTISNLGASCVGGSLQVTVASGGANGSGSATVPGGGTLTVTLGSSVAVSGKTQTDVVIAGP